MKLRHGQQAPQQAPMPRNHDYFTRFRDYFPRGFDYKSPFSDYA